MREIVEITIINFASHKKTVLQPTSAGKVTVLTGQSRCGKSNIFRALRKLFYNIPEGCGFIRTGANECVVSVKYDDGYIVSYRRTRGGISRYTVSNADGKTADYDEGRAGMVPMEVQEITGIKPITIGGIEPLNINLAEQLDGPFLGTKVTTAPARAKILGKLAGTEELDYASKGLGVDIHRRKVDEKKFTEDVEKHQNNLKQYEHLEDLEKTIKAIGLIREKVKKFTELRNKLTELATQRDCLLIKIRAKEERFAGTKFVEDAQAKLAALIEKANSKALFSRLCTRKNELVYSIIRVEDVLKDTQNITMAGELLRLVEVKKVHFSALNRLKTNWISAKTGISNAKMVIIASENIPVADKKLIDFTAKLEKKKKFETLSVQRNQFRSAFIQAKAIIVRTDSLVKAEELLNKVIDARIKREKLDVLAAKVDNYGGEVWQADKTLNVTVNLSVSEQILTRIVENRNRQRELYVLYDKQDTLLADIRRCIHRYDEVSNHMNRDKEKYLEILKQAGVCPTCGNEISPEKIKEVVC